MRQIFSKIWHFFWKTGKYHGYKWLHTKKTLFDDIPLSICISELLFGFRIFFLYQFNCEKSKIMIIQNSYNSLVESFLAWRHKRGAMLLHFAQFAAIIVWKFSDFSQKWPPFQKYLTYFQIVFINSMQRCMRSNWQDLLGW